MKITKVKMIGDRNPDSGLPYMYKDEALKRFISQTEPAQRLVYKYSQPKSNDLLPEGTAIGYICDIDYCENTATIASYYDNDLNEYTLAFSMLGETTDECIIIDKIISSYIK